MKIALKNLKSWTEIKAKTEAKVERNKLAHDVYGDQWLIVEFTPYTSFDGPNWEWSFPSELIGCKALLNLGCMKYLDPGTWWNNLELKLWDVEEQPLSKLSKQIIAELVLG